MVQKINECIIIGGGSSIKEGINLGLKDFLKDKFVIACNYAYKHFLHTFMCFVDRDFYVPSYAKKFPEKNPDIYEELKNESLIIGANHSGISEFKLPNTILIKAIPVLKPIQSSTEGFYTKNFLTESFALSLACYLLNYSGRIFLLGFDWTQEGNTHYYAKEEFNHRGIGYTNSYNKHNPNYVFKPYLQFKNLSIYNISLISNITCFQKITYSNMFSSNIKSSTISLEYIKSQFVL